LKIIISQQNKKILITLKSGKVVDKYRVDKAEEFLTVIDKFFRKCRIRKIRRIGRISRIGHIGQIGHIEFENTGVLTERIIRSIIAGLRFSTLRVVPRRGKAKNCYPAGDFPKGEILKN